MKTAKFIRIFAVLGILGLLFLQYSWFKNSYTLMEHDILEKANKSLSTSIEMDMTQRMEPIFGKNLKTVVTNSTALPEKVQTISNKNYNQNEGFSGFMQDALSAMGKPCQIEGLDSIFKANLFKAIGFPAKYSLSLVTAKVKEKTKPDKFTFFEKITKDQYAMVTLINPLQSILRQAQMIIAVSILLVIIIGVVLIYLLRSTLKEAKFVNFIKEYTHALTHELKTPISGIYMASSQLSTGVFEEKPEARQRYYGMMKESSSKLLSTVDRILLVAKAEHSKITTNPSPTEVKPFVEKIVEIHRSNNFRRKIVELTFSCEPEALMGNFDPFLMENVLNNLIDNAMKYSEEQVKIEISAGIADNKLEFRLKDNGFGIAENELKHIFDNFERGNRVQGKGIDGFGIGLNYVNKVVHAHKGSIEVTSQEGVGTEFCIHLPV
ncbi:MAG: HAMP domain-containing sensor histidine kinase [Bacteroidia bacterium]|nr:HAMP domain-containing sensor histidine kinase [Bacteroidia bacterium]